MLASLHARAFFFKIAKVSMKAVEEARDILSLRAQTRASGSDDCRIQSEPLRDVDSSGCSRNADLQLIRRLQRGLVEADRSVDHSRRIRAIDFERSVVGRDHDHASDFAEVFGDCDRQRRAFFGISGRAEFVEQHQRMRSRGARDEIDVRNVCREGREVLLDRLIVTDVSKNGIENRHVGAIRRNGNSGLRHQSEQAEGFQSDGFAASVGAGDYELAMVAFQLDGDGNDLCVLKFQIAFKERMPCAMEEQATGVRYRFGGRQRNRDAVVVFGEAGFGELKFQFGEDVGSGQNRVGVFSNLARHLEEDAMNLGLFFIEQAHEFVVLLDGFERLDKDGLSAGTGAVDDALHTTLLLDFHRDDKPLAADGDQLVLHGPAFGEFAQVAAQRFLDLTLLFFGVAANAAKLGRCAIVERAVGQNLVVKRAQEAGEILDTSGKRLDGGPRGAHRGWRLTGDFAPLGCAVGDEDYIADLGGFKSGSAYAGFLNQLLDFGEAGEFEASADATELADFCRQLLLSFNPRAIE